MSMSSGFSACVLTLALLGAVGIAVSESQGVQATPSSAGSPSTDAVTGGALFNGSRRMANGGPQCIACHSVAGLGTLGGGAVGPDLTPAFTKWGREQGLTAVLANMPFPTMIPIYRDRRLTSQEQAELVAFLRQSASGVASQGLLPLLLYSIAGASGLIVLLYAIWSGRLKNVRDALASR